MKTNNDKLERIRKRHANIVGYRKAVLRGRQGNRAERVQRNLALQRPGATGLRRYHRRLHQTSGTGYRRSDQRPVREVCGESAEPIAREILNQWFRFSKAQFQPDDEVYVNSWGYGIVKGIVKGRIQVFAPQFGATGATIYVGYDRLQRVG